MKRLFTGKRTGRVRLKKAGKAIRMAVQFRSFRRGLLRYAARHNSTGSIPGRNAKLRSGVALFHYTLRAMPLVPFTLRSGTRHSMPRPASSFPFHKLRSTARNLHSLPLHTLDSLPPVVPSSRHPQATPGIFLTPLSCIGFTLCL